MNRPTPEQVAALRAAHARMRALGYGLRNVWTHSKTFHAPRLTAGLCETVLEQDLAFLRYDREGSAARVQVTIKGSRPGSACIADHVASEDVTEDITSALYPDYA